MAKSNAASGKNFNFFLPIEKVDKKKRTVSGYASTPTKDLDGEIVSLDAVKSALPGYMEWRNIREMHKPSAVGIASEANVDAQGLFLTAKIVDDAAWEKCLEGVYKGFSIGGRKLAKSGDTITEIDLVEISVVDRPANPDCKIEVAKMAKGKIVNGEEAHLVEPKVKKSATARALKKMAQAVEALAKDGPPAAHDGFSLPSKPKKNKSPKDDDEGINKDDEDGGGDGEIANVVKREYSTAQRKTYAASGVALPDGSFPIPDKDALSDAVSAFGRASDKAQAKKHIISRARALGAEGMLPKKWAKKAAKLAKREAKALALAKRLAIARASTFNLTTSSRDSAERGPSFLVLKSADDAETPSRVEDFELGSPNSPLGDEPRNDGHSNLTLKSASREDLLAALAKVVGQNSEPSDDLWLNDLIKEFEMDSNTENNTVGLDQAMLNLLKRAAMPTKMARMKMARDNIEKARMARKTAKRCVEEAHGMVKAMYLSKLAKKAKGKDPDGDDDNDFNAEDCMGKLQKAFSAIDSMKTFMKAADTQLEKAASRAGERGQEAGDPEAGYYEVPAGVKDLSPASMASAAPGTTGGGSTPPMYPTDGSVYPGKNAKPDGLAKFTKNGMVPVEIAKLVAENERLHGTLETVSRIPQNNGRRPYAFNTGTVFGKDATNGGEVAGSVKKLFEGLNPEDLNSGDEHIQRSTAATVAGRLLMTPSFGKSVLSPEFRGAAGGRS